MLRARRARQTVALALLVTGLAVCGGITAHAVSVQSPSVTLTLARFFGECSSKYQGITDPTKGVDECSEIQILTNKWNATHPTIHIQAEVTDPGAYLTRLSAAIASGSPPDIALLHGSDIPAFASKGVLTPLGPALRKAGVDLTDAVPTAITYASYKGTLYALPFDIHTLLWYVNVDLFKKAGLVDKQGNPVIPQNAAQFVAEARVMKHKTGKQFVQAQTIDADLGTDWMFDTLVWQQGSDVLTKKDTQAAVNSPQALRAVTFWSSLIKAGYTTATVKDTNSMFLNGNVATLINGTWAVNQFGTQVKDHQAAFTHLAVVPLPTLFGHPASWSDSHTWTIPRQSSPDPAKTAADLQVLKYLYDNDLQWTRTGHLSVRKSVLASRTYRTLPYRGEDVRAALIAHPMPRIMSIGTYETIMHNDILAIYLGQKSASAALADAEQRVNQALKTSH